MSKLEGREVTESDMLADMLADMQLRIAEMHTEIVLPTTIHPKQIKPTNAAFAAMARSRNLADEAQDAAGGLGKVLAVAAESQLADRGQAVQQSLVDFGAWVREQRDARKWTLDQLAEKIGSTGPQISLVERGIGKRGPSLALIARILWAFDLELLFPLADNK